MLSAEDAARYARQIMLAEVGLAGQRRIKLAVANVASPSDNDSQQLRYQLAERYARRAGFASLQPARLDLDVLAPSPLVTQPAAREVLAGCRAALIALRAALAPDSTAN